MLPDEQAEYVLEQMRVYLEIRQTERATEEYQKVEIIFNALLNVMSEENYKILADTLCNTSKQLSSLSGHSFAYWSVFVKYMHWKLTGRVE